MKTAVAIAMYNGGKYIREQLESLLRQSLKPDSVVISDDCSSDDSVAIVQDYIALHGLSSTWSVEVNKENLGYAKNFYKAISLCMADVVFLCDQDDIWADDKIEKMTYVMQNNPHISLLSCKHSVIDSKGKLQSGIMIEKANNTGKISQITVADVLRASRWPGMTMAVKKAFFLGNISILENLDTYHDLLLALLAADKGQFYEVDHVGAFHRRHSGNAAREEHRVKKNLDLGRKILELKNQSEMLTLINEARLPLNRNTLESLETRFKLSQKRYQMLMARDLFGILNLYLFHSHGYLRLYSFLCDFWLICFGDYKNLHMMK